jgi:hypothetical protein
VRLDAVGEHLEALGAPEVGDRFAADVVDQPANALVAEVLGVGGVRVQRALDLVVVPWRADADPRVEPAAGQQVDGGQVWEAAASTATGDEMPYCR